MREIISLQGGNPRIGLDDFNIGGEVKKVRSKKSGMVLWMDNNLLVEIARSAGSPKDKGVESFFIKNKMMWYDLVIYYLLFILKNPESYHELKIYYLR